MKFSSFVVAVAAGAHVSNALSIPEVSDISVRDAIPDFLDNFSPVESAHDLFKRKGGGGRGGGSSSSGGSSSGGSSSGGSSSGGSSSGGSSSGGSSSGGGRTSGSGSSGSSGSSGGSRGTSVSPSYGGGRYYGGGATSAYTAGSRSPRGISPFVIAPLAIFPGLWLYSVYAYPYSHPYHFYNRTATNSSNPDGMNQTKPVECLCQQYNPCGCDDDGNSTALDAIIGNGSYAALNKSLATVSDVNGTSTIVINGTLPNGTEASTTSSGASSTSSSTGAAAGIKALEWSGYWVMGATVLLAVYGL